MKNVKINDVENDFLKYFNEGMKYDDICSKLNVTKASISYYVKKHNLVHPSKINKINDTIFNSFNEENIYWLGYLWADGSVQNTEKNHTIDLETIDKEHAIKFSKFLGLNKIKERNRNNSITFRVNGSSKKIANKLYEELRAIGVDALLDDRNERAGVKFKDSELIGIPMRVTVGKKITDGEVEFKLRDGEMETIKIEEVVSRVRDEFQKNNIKL